MDRTNVRHIEPGDLPFAPTFATCDASFISARLFVDIVFRELAPGGVFVLLVKPQFEVGKDKVPRGGVVRDDKVRWAALESVRQAALEVGFVDRGAVDSELPGPKGNREILLALEKPS